MPTYIVPLTSATPSREELKWACKFTVFARAAGCCEECGVDSRRLEWSHVLSRLARPDLEFDPDNCRALCATCHTSYDRRNGHIPPGRPVGTKMPPEFGQRIGEKLREIHGSPEKREFFRQKAKAEWERRGRKNPVRPCEQCGKELSSRQASRRGRFCSNACKSEFRRGKPRGGY